MKKNMGTIDRIARAVIATVIFSLWLAGVLKGLPAIILLIIAAILVLTAIIGICPLYLPFGFSTRKKT
jgi:hypothetical protein